MASARKIDNPLFGRLLTANDLVDDDVYDEAGKCLGEIEDIVLDPSTGCIRFAVLALGGFMGFGRKRYAVPWSALTPDPGYHRCVISATKMRLMAVPMWNDVHDASLAPFWGTRTIVD